MIRILSLKIKSVESNATTRCFRGYGREGGRFRESTSDVRGGRGGALPPRELDARSRGYQEAL